MDGRFPFPFLSASCRPLQKYLTYHVCCVLPSLRAHVCRVSIVWSACLTWGRRHEGSTGLYMVHVRFGSRPPSWSQNQVKVLVDAESSLYSSSIETPGPARPWRENVLRPRSSAGLPRLYPFWIIPSNLFPLLCLKPLISLSV